MLDARRVGSRLWRAIRRAITQEGQAVVNQGATVENNTAGWTEISVDVLDARDGLGVPFRLVLNRFSSSSDDAERFIHDPLTFMIADADNVRDGTGEPSDVFKSLDRSWHVVTTVLNHHRTLSVRHANVISCVDQQETTVGVTIVKTPPTG
jgi:hypothetical protein